MSIYGNSINNIKIINIKDEIAEKYIYQMSNMKNNFEILRSYCNGEIIIDPNNDKLVGAIFVGDTKDKGFISNLEVMPKYRKHGYGSLLLKDAINKYNGIDLTVRKTNSNAIRLYKKFNFVCIKFTDCESNPFYWMKLKSKLTKDDKIMEVSKNE